MVRQRSSDQLAPICRRLVSESLRLEPAASVVDRYATVSTELGGIDIEAGDLVVVSLAGANRDPSVFRDPDAMVLDRDGSRRHLAFARGPHTCLGIHLATLQTTLALQRFLERLPAARLDRSESTDPAGLIFRKPDRLLVRW